MEREGTPELTDCLLTLSGLEVRGCQSIRQDGEPGGSPSVSTI
jgi:hypothetical protein